MPPILCLEGPSAVGKTTVAAALADGGARVVPEVNLLFERPADEAPDWYLERQVDRWALAAGHARRGSLAVLDGDPFQPLWYTWAYDFVGWPGLDFLEAFYRPRVARGKIGFPDRYVVLRIDEARLRARKEGDATRRRRGFETHLRMIGPQRRYFEAMRSFAPGRVRFVDAKEVAATVRIALESVGKEMGGGEEPLELFDRLVGWLREHRANEQSLPTIDEA